MSVLKGEHPPRIDYDGAWIGGVVPALLSGDRYRWRDTDLPAWMPDPVQDASTVVLFVLDGLGWDMVRTMPSLCPNLAAMTGGPISSAFPSTTATGLTSITTGLPAASHGIMGYAMRVGGQVMSALQWRIVGGGKAPSPVDVQPRPAFCGHRSPVVTKAEFHHTGFTKAHLGSGPFVAWQTPAVMVEQIRRLARNGQPFVYAYYDGVDKVAHAHGLDNDYFFAELAETDRLVGQVLGALSSDMAVLVTADHGQVAIPPEGKRTLDPVSRMVAAFSGEGRVRGLFARPGAVGDLRAACHDLYDREAWVMTRDELFDGGWFGNGASPRIRSRCGDVVLIAKEPVGFLAPNFPAEADLHTMHGSLTPAETQVPLLAARGTQPQRLPR